MFKSKKFSSNIDFCIIGLGNPGREYENTRHNVGFITLDYIAEKLDVSISKLKFKSLYTIADYKGKKIMLIKPQTFMNLSGQAVVEALQFYKLDISNAVVICDDVNFDIGKLRIRRKGSDGGQNGVKNIIYLSNRDDFARIKLGVGKKPSPDYNLADWVLSKFRAEEMQSLESAVKSAAEAALMIADGEIDKAMNRYNN